MRLGFATILLIPAGCTANPPDPRHDIVWVWNAQCPSPTEIQIRVRLDQTTVYNGSLPICRWERRFENGKASFRFAPGRPVVWYGYQSDEGDGTKDPGDTTAAGTPLEIQFWQAGGEPDAIALAYTVSAADGLHMNAIHLLSPTERSTTTMAPGLVLDTWPRGVVLTLPKQRLKLTARVDYGMNCSSARRSLRATR